MARSRELLGSMALVWTLGVPAAALGFMTGALNLGLAIAEATGSEIAMVLFLPVSAMLGMVAWILALDAVWRLRRRYLQRVGKTVSAEVLESDLRHKSNRGLLGFGQWQVRIEARFGHTAAAHPSSARCDVSGRRRGRGRGVLPWSGCGGAGLMLEWHECRSSVPQPVSTPITPSSRWFSKTNRHPPT
ncbi:hypothetical protein [Nocardia paucivorans]|uniref:hypothetical protein n=1 Tax=Nocardia paucivorans TaxID=114259 RepID=UPI00030A00F7|nr:hypothetical protein [Nocardia paucivorans]